MIKIAEVSGTPLHFLKETRDYFISCREKATENVRLGLNYNIIINTAFILEAESEQLLHSIVEQYEFLYIKYYQLNLKDVDRELAKNVKKLLSESFYQLKCYISKSTGIKEYTKIFQMLIPECQLDSLLEYQEGIQVLYQLRNVIAHGRAVRFEERTHYAYPDYDNEVLKEINFSGGYKRAQEYLIKKGLLCEPITETHEYKTLFCDRISDYFVKLESDYFEAWKKCVPFEIIDFKDDYEKLV